jgi:hypothetical protein
LADTPVDPDRVRRAIGVVLQPDGQQLLVGARVGVESSQAVDLGTEDFGGGWRDDLKLGAGHFGLAPVASDY